MSQANFSDDAKSVVQAIQDGVRTETIDVDGKEFVTRPVYLPPEKPDVGALYISTLDGLIEYLNQNVDDHVHDELVVVVNSPRSVSVYRQIESSQDNRTLWLNAEYEVEGFPFGRFIDHEQFMVAAQALVCQTDERDQLMKFIGNLTTANVTNSIDDGTSQSVVVETGVRKSTVELPNPVRLAPMRTFAEVNQPYSPFVLRVRQQREGQMPEIALFEADGGLWRIDAIKHIKNYIAVNLAEDVNIPVIG